MKKQLVASGLALALCTGSFVAVSSPANASSTTTWPSNSSSDQVILPAVPKPHFTQHPNSIDISWGPRPESVSNWHVSVTFEQSNGYSEYARLTQHLGPGQESASFDTSAAWQKMITANEKPAVVHVYLSGNFPAEDGKNYGVGEWADPQIPLLPNGKQVELPKYSTRSTLGMLNGNHKEIVLHRKAQYPWANHLGLSLRASFSRKDPTAAVWFTPKGSKKRKQIGTLTFSHTSAINWDPPTREYGGSFNLKRVPSDGKLTLSYKGSKGPVLMGNRTFAELSDTDANYSVNVTRGWVKFTNKRPVKVTHSPPVLKVAVPMGNTHQNSVRVALQQRKGKRWVTIKRNNIWGKGEFYVYPNRSTTYRLKVEDPYRYSVVSKSLRVNVKQYR